VDTNPQTDAVNYSDDLLKYIDIELLVYYKGNWACPTCKTDGYLTDDINIIINRGYRTKLVEAAKKFDILLKEGAEEFEKIRNLLINHGYDKNIYQFIEAQVVDAPTGRKLSYTEREKVGNHFNNYYAISTTLSRDGKLYFGYLDGENNDAGDGKINTWGYITEEQVNDITKPKPKPVEIKKVNPAKELPFYKKLMNKLH
jgi:hypothetical protein